MDILGATPPGAGGEIQLTDAIGELVASRPVFAVPLPGRAPRLRQPGGVASRHRRPRPRGRRARRPVRPGPRGPSRRLARFRRSPAVNRYSVLALARNALRFGPGWQALWRSPEPAGVVRRGDRRRGRARARDRVLPRLGARDQQRRGAREGVDRRRQHGPQHHHRPVELSLGRGRRALREVPPALRGAEPGAQLQRHVQPARGVQPRPLGPRDAGHRSPGQREPAERGGRDGSSGPTSSPVSSRSSTYPRAAAIRCLAHRSSPGAGSPATMRSRGGSPAPPMRAGSTSSRTAR